MKVPDRHDQQIHHLAEERSRSRAGLVGFLAGAALAVAAALLIIQNRGEVSMTWVTFDTDGPLWVFLLLAFAAGAVASPLLLAAWRHQRELRAQRRTVVDRAASSHGRRAA